MDALKFIQNDVERGNRISALQKLLLSSVLFVFPILFGLGIREGFEGILSLRILIPNVIAAMLLMSSFQTSYLKNFSSAAAFRVSFGLFALAAFLAVERMFFPVGGLRTEYETSQIFWQEALKCLYKGAGESLLMGIYLSLVIRYTASSPQRRVRVFLSTLAGLSGTVMLGFHCDSSSVGHVVVAHLGQGLAIGVIVFLIQEMMFQIELRKNFPKLIRKLKRVGRLG